MPIGTRRKGSFTRWRVWVPRALVDRVETFYFNPNQARKRVYGYRSQLVTTLLSEWAGRASTSFTGAGHRRHNSPEMVELALSIPTELADKVGQLAPSATGPIFGFRAQLITLLLERWADAREEELRASARSLSLNSSISPPN